MYILIQEIIFLMSGACELKREREREKEGEREKERKREKERDVLVNKKGKMLSLIVHLGYALQKFCIIC